MGISCTHRIPARVCRPSCCLVGPYISLAAWPAGRRRNSNNNDLANFGDGQRMSGLLRKPTRTKSGTEPAAPSLAARPPAHNSRCSLKPEIRSEGQWLLVWSSLSTFSLFAQIVKKPPSDFLGLTCWSCSRGLPSLHKEMDKAVLYCLMGYPIEQGPARTG